MSSEIFQLRRSMETLPACLNAAQNMVMAMADAENARGKRSFFGADKYIPAYKNALEKTSDFIGALYSEGLAATPQGDEAVMKVFREFMDFFKTAYPNWQDAYSFMERFLDPQNSALHSELISKHRSWNEYLSRPAITRSKKQN